MVTCCCSEKHRRERIFADRFYSLQNEVHVTYILKTLRVLKGLAVESVGKESWRSASDKYARKYYEKNTLDDGSKKIEKLELEHEDYMAH